MPPILAEITFVTAFRCDLGWSTVVEYCSSDVSEIKYHSLPNADCAIVNHVCFRNEVIIGTDVS